MQNLLPARSLSTPYFIPQSSYRAATLQSAEVNFSPFFFSAKLSVSVATLQSLAVKKKPFFVQILGGEKLLKFVEKCR